nr:hypothetical protein [Candidatus Neomarinimicrobiota bacterium]
NDPDGEMEEMGFDVGWPERNGFDGVKGYIEDKKLENPDLFDQIDEYWLDRLLAGPEEDAVKWMVEQLVELDRDAEGRFVAGNLIYSLRDKNGESHVSAEYDPNNHEIGTTEARGKQNEPARDKYKPYIKKLDAFFIQHPEKFGPR